MYVWKLEWEHKKTKTHSGAFALMKSKADRNSLETTHKRVTGAVKADPLRWQSQGFNYIRIYSGPEMKFSGFNETRDFDISSAKYSCKSLHPLQKLGAQCSKRLSQLKRMVNCIKRHRKKKHRIYTHIPFSQSCSQWHWLLHQHYRYYLFETAMSRKANKTGSFWKMRLKIYWYCCFNSLPVNTVKVSHLGYFKAIEMCFTQRIASCWFVYRD